MPVFDITSPEGKNYEVTTPDGVAASDVMAHFQSIAAQSPVDTAPATATPQSGGIISDLVNSQRQRGAALANTVNDIAASPSGRTPVQAMGALGQAGLQMAGDVGNTVGDLVGAGVQTAMKVNPSIALGKVYFHQLPQDTQQNIQSKIAAPIQAYNNNDAAYTAANPVAAKNFQAVRGLANILPVGNSEVRAGLEGAAEGIGEGAQKLAQAGGDAKSVLGDKIMGTPLATPNDVRSLSTKLYQDSADKGAQLPPSSMSNFVDDIQSINPKSKIASALQGDTAASKAIGILNDFKNEPLDMNDIDGIDKVLTRKANDSWKDNAPTADTRDILQIQDKFRKMVDDSESQDGVQSWKDAKSTFAVSKRLDDIQNIFDHAALMTNEATAIQSGFRNLLDSPSRLRGYSPEAQKFMQKAATNQFSVDLLKTMGSRLLPIVAGGVGGGVGATAATAVGSSAMRDMAAAVKVRQGNKVANEVIKGLNPSVLAKLPPREALKAIGKK